MLLVMSQDTSFQLYAQLQPQLMQKRWDRLFLTKVFGLNLYPMKEFWKFKLPLAVAFCQSSH